MKKFFLCAMAMLLVVACGTTEEEKRQQTRQERAEQKRLDSLALKVAVMPTIDGLPLFIAKERGWFESAGVDVRLVSFHAQMDVDTALIGGSVTGGITDLVRAERMKKGGLALRYAARTIAGWQLIGNRTARLKEPRQLGDKMVAMTRFSATDFLTDEALKGTKTTATVYRVQINDVLLRLQMLKNNEMDALWLPEPHATVARKMGHPVLWDSKQHDFLLGVLAFRDKAYKDQRIAKQIEAVMNAYNIACDSLNKQGMAGYADVIEKYCAMDERYLQSLPKIVFEHATKPREQDVAAARSWLGL